MKRLPHQVAVISGKGGTGKTTVMAGIAALMKDVVLADCDVDASNLHLLTSPITLARDEFQSGVYAQVDPSKCRGCGSCKRICRFDAVKDKPKENNTLCFLVDPMECEGCGVCAHFCPEQAISLVPRTAGEWMISDTRFGPLVHATLYPAAENSGKLVSFVRQIASRIAEETQRKWILIDGPPGVSCPVIATISGVDAVLVVTEPSVAALSDMERILDLTGHFRIPTFVAINKWDIFPEMTGRIEATARNRGVTCVGRIRFDPTVNQAQFMEKTVSEMDARSTEDLAKLWVNLHTNLNSIFEC